MVLYVIMMNRYLIFNISFFLMFVAFIKKNEILNILLVRYNFDIFTFTRHQSRLNKSL